MKKLKVIILNYSKKHHFLLWCIRKVRFVLGSIKYTFYYFSNKVDNNVIVFESFMGRSYSDSPKAIYEFMIHNKNYSNFEYVWFFRDSKDYAFLTKNKNTKVIKYKSKDYYKYYAKAKYWVTNSIIIDFIKKKKRQIYLQCWHGTPLKKLRCDIEKNGSALNTAKDFKNKNNKDVKKINYFISPSSFCNYKFTSAFNLKELNKENILINVGYPRNDRLINYKIKEIELIRKKLKLPKDKKVILYAPTFRDDEHDSGLGYTYELGINLDYLKKNISEDYVILFRAHYFVANKIDFSKYKNFIYDVSKYDDINDLFIVSDMLITDYSSVLFDYALLSKPMLFYMYDLENYKNNLRDFYFNVEELPGPIIREEKNLIKTLKNIEKYNLKYSKKYEEFNKKYNYLEDGKSSKKLVEECIK